MPSKYQETQRSKQVKLIQESTLFEGISGGAYYRSKERDFVLKDSSVNLYKSIRKSACEYMRENIISWWGGENLIIVVNYLN